MKFLGGDPRGFGWDHLTCWDVLLCCTASEPVLSPFGYALSCGLAFSKGGSNPRSWCSPSASVKDREVFASPARACGLALCFTEMSHSSYGSSQTSSALAWDIGLVGVASDKTSWSRSELTGRQVLRGEGTATAWPAGTRRRACGCRQHVQGGTVWTHLPGHEHYHTVKFTLQDCSGFFP